MIIADEIKKRYYKVFNKELDLKNPVLFTEKLQYLKIHETTKLKSICADKLKVQDYFIDTLGKNIGFPIFDVYHNADELDNISHFPVIAKCNHGSGMNKVFNNKRDVILSINTFDYWLNTDYSLNSIEPWYRYIEPSILIEPYIVNFQEIKMFVFNGETKIIEILDNNAHRYYDTKWNQLPWLKRTYHPSPENIIDKKPDNLEELCEISNKLAEPFKFVRVDFIIDNDTNKFYCSEMTFAPGAGFCVYSGDGDMILGEMLKI